MGDDEAQEGVVDAKRGKMFAKLIKNIEVAARTGGGDPAGNPTLYDAIQKAKKSSVPNDNIDRAVKRGSGAEAGGADYQTIMYEGYGPNGVRVLIECLTDNRNRAAAEVRTALTRNGGTLADPGSVSYLFSRKGVVVVPKASARARTTCCWPCSTRAPRRSTTSATRSRSSASRPTWSRCRTALQDAGIDYDSADVSFVPSVAVPLDEDGARKIFRLIDALEDSDDVQNVYATST
jgi:YebC/PmpR family DNA-binding regulatory protein